MPVRPLPTPPRHAVACACLLALLAAPAAPQDTSADASPAPLKRAQADARLRLGFERTRLPGGERMGLVGMTELFNVGGEWWVGPGVYGAATGHRGGLLVPGVEAAWSHPFSELLAVDAGLFAGGGGGAGAPVGGGLMLRPHVDLVLRMDGFYTGPTWSKVRFPNGSIDSNQFGWMLNFDSAFRFRHDTELHPGARTDGTATGLGFDAIDGTITRWKPVGSRTTGGLPLKQSIELVGARGEHVIDGPLWGGLEAAGAAHGGVAGYAEVLGTVGLRFPVVAHRLALGVRGAVGLGGGGGIDTGGGMLVKAATDLRLRLTDSLGIGAEAGIVDAPNHGHFKAGYGQVSLDWQLDPLNGRQPGWDAEHTATHMEYAGGAERYRAARKDGTTRTLDAVTLSVDRFVTPSIYITGQAHSAFAGGAGAYSVGLIGLGGQVEVAPRLRLGLEALAGAAGGGGVDTEGGAIAQGRAYADIGLTPALSLRVGGGKIRSMHGRLDAPVVDAELVFRFGADRRR
ncbi:MAG: hypothetical protein ACTHL8_02795 [Burkholderiaceae bacterium]